MFGLLSLVAFVNEYVLYFLYDYTWKKLIVENLECVG